MGGGCKAGRKQWEKKKVAFLWHTQLFTLERAMEPEIRRLQMLHSDA